jgi:hypothetical protein
MSDETSIKTFAYGDVIIILFLVTVLFVSSKNILQNDLRAKTVEIVRDNRILAVYPLHENRLIKIEGAIGPMTIRIEDGAARVIQSQCRCGICTRSTPVSKPNHCIICVPNHIVIRVPSHKKNDQQIDAIAE